MALFRHNTPPPPAPAWVKLGVMLFLAAAFGSYMLNPVPVNQSLQSKKLFDYDAYRGQIIPSFGMLQITDTQDGSGEAALCGQEAKIRYSETATDAAEKKDAPLISLTFRLGSGDAPRALSDSVLGMRGGGERSVTVPASRTQGKLAPLRYTIALDSLSPVLTAPKDALSLRIYDTRFGDGAEVACGDSATFHLTLWSGKGEKLLDTHAGTPLTAAIGSGALPAGLNEALRGMREGGARAAMLPPALQAPLSADSSIQNAEILHKLPASADGIALAEIELLPPPASAPPQPEPQPEPEPKP